MSGIEADSAHKRMTASIFFQKPVDVAVLSARFRELKSGRIAEPGARLGGALPLTPR